MLDRPQAELVASAIRTDADSARSASPAPRSGFMAVPSYPLRAGLLRFTAEAAGADPAAHDVSELAAETIDGDSIAALRRSAGGAAALDGQRRASDSNIESLRREHSGALRTPDPGSPPASALQGEAVIRRYFDDWPATDEQDTSRKVQFDTYVENAKIAGIPVALAESAGLTVLQFWKGWSSHYAPEFDHAWVTGPRGFQTALATRLKDDYDEGAVKTLLKEVFNPGASEALLVQLGQAAGFAPGAEEPADELGLRPEDEEELIKFYADRFESRGDWKGQGAGFKAAWSHATVLEKERVLVILQGPNWRTNQEWVLNPHLSDLSYLVEGVTGRTPRSPMDIQNWVKSPRGSLFEYMRNNAGYKTKYMTEEERKAYRLSIVNGRIFRSDEEPLVGDNIFVLSTDNVFYGGSKRSGLGMQDTDTTEALHHSSFLAGEPVVCAGHFITDSSGQLNTVTDQSGHYAPSDNEFASFLYGLRNDHGVALDKVNFRDGTAEEFLRPWMEQWFPEGETTTNEEEQGPFQDDDSFDENDIFKNPFV